MAPPTEFVLRVESAPPVKQTPADAAERASQAALNEAIRVAFEAQHPGGWSILPADAELELVIRYERGVRRSDGANIAGGIADQLERLRVYPSDLQLRRIDYEEWPSHDGRDRYHVIVRRRISAGS